MSVGVNVMFLLAEFAARRLRDCDAEISESHHRGKKDAPSGTALRLGEAVAAATGVNFADNAVFSRHGRDNIRRRGQIGFSVVRGGDIIGEHRLLFAGEGEQLEIVHRSSGRANYAHGAIAAARFAAAAPPRFIRHARCAGVSRFCLIFCVRRDCRDCRVCAVVPR